MEHDHIIVYSETLRLSFVSDTQRNMINSSTAPTDEQSPCVIQQLTHMCLFFIGRGGGVLSLEFSEVYCKPSGDNLPFTCCPADSPKE